MATPKGTRNKSFKINSSDAVFVYSEGANIWLQLRRDYPTLESISVSSFKSALNISSDQAIAIATELLAVASSQKNKQPLNNTAQSLPSVQVPENHGKQWSEEEEKQLLSRYNSGLSIEDIAKRHKRGIGGVQSRLVKAGKIEALEMPNRVGGRF